MSLVDSADEPPNRKISAAAHRTLRHLNCAQALYDAENKRFLENNLSGKVTLELFYVDGHLEQPGKVTSSVVCKA